MITTPLSEPNISDERTNNMLILNYFKTKPKREACWIDECYREFNVNKKIKEISKQLKQVQAKLKELSTEFGSQQSERRLESML